MGRGDGVEGGERENNKGCTMRKGVGGSSFAQFLDGEGRRAPSGCLMPPIIGSVGSLMPPLIDNSFLRVVWHVANENHSFAFRWRVQRSTPPLIDIPFLRGRRARCK